MACLQGYLISADMDNKREDEIKRYIDDMVARYDIARKSGLSKESIERRIRRGVILNNLAYILADAANTALRDMECELTPLGVGLSYNDKYNFNKMISSVKDARKWSEKAAMPIYDIPNVDDVCAESDWWYNFLVLIDDRLGDDERKTNMLLEYILNMPSEVGVFNITYDDFKRFKPEKK